MAALPFEIMAIITGCWVLIGAIKIMPYFVNRNINKPGGSVSNIIKHVDDKIDKIDTKVNDVIAKIDTIAIPDDIPTMEAIESMVEAARQKTTENLLTFQRSIPNLILQTLDTQEFETLIKSYEGRMYRAKGIDMADHTKGLDAAKEIYLHEIENTSNTSEQLQVLRNVLKLAAENDLIDPDSVDQKIGLIQGISQIIKQVTEAKGANKQTAGGLKPPR